MSAATEAPMAMAAGRPRIAVHALLVLSGFAGLGYQVVWTRMLSVGLGHEIFAVLAVVSAFFAGLALGALLLDRPIARSARPGAWYAGLEVLIGLYTLALIGLIPWANGVFAWLIGPDPSEVWRWTIAFLGPALLLMPSTVAMGATMPAAERLNARLVESGRTLGGLYAANAGGAMLGALLTAGWLAAAFGFTATLVIFAAINFLCAAGAMLGPARGEAARPAVRDAATAPGQGAEPLMLVLLAATGLVGVGFEVAVVRALAQVMENTVYSFAAVLAIYLLGTTLGAAAYQRLHAARRAPGWDRPMLAFLAALTALACGLGTLGLLVAAPGYEAMAGALSRGLGAGLTAEIALALVALLPGSAAMGALFAHVAQGARGRAGGLGAAFAANTCGAAFAALVVGVVAIPAIGVTGTLIALSASYLVIVAAALGVERRTLAVAGGALAVTAVAALGPLDRRFAAALPEGEIVAQIEGVAATATVIGHGTGDRVLTVNGGLVMGGTASYRLDRIQGHFALLRHPAPRRALFLGVGTGATLAAAAPYDGLRIEGVELLREVLDLVPEFADAHADLVDAAPRLSLHVADARRHVALDGPAYDVILADNYHPAKDGAGLLYTVEHFAAIRERLSADGVFVQWLPLHQLDMPTLRLIVRSFRHVFPEARLSVGNANIGTPLLALWASRDDRAPRLAALARRPMPEALRQALARLDYTTPFALFGGFLAGPGALAAFAGEGPLNTDDHPRVLFEAPRTVYAPLAPPIDRLLALIDTLERRAGDAVDIRGVPGGVFFAERLERYWAARDAFIAFGAERAAPDAPEIDLAALGGRLVEILHLSPDYTPALFPAIRMAIALGERDKQAGLGMLVAIEQAVPNRVETRRARARIIAAP